MRVIVLFIDGIGLGDNNSKTNPFIRFGFPVFEELFACSLQQDITPLLMPTKCIIPIDATLGIPGLPQSATGQAAILTGLNAAQIMGRHIQAFPGPELAKLITENNVMKKLVDDGLTVTSANMYSPNYFELVAKRKRRHSAITLAALSTGMSLRSLPEIESGQAIYQDITNEMLPTFGIDTIPVIEPKEAASKLVNISRKYSFTIFEYFQTDRAGHKQNWAYARQIIKILNEFIETIYQTLPADTLLLITSDHGNFEDLSVKTHTRNKVPLIALGVKAQTTISNITDLTGITPAIVEVLRKDESI
ncbi:MAG: hypothetical protein H6Q72_16 [Firmicutes bacterium]|nr:hypothetical protein [Bacillota bacterium]